MADAASFSSPDQLYKYYQTNFNVGASGNVYPQGVPGGPPIELTDRVFHAPVPSPNGSARGFTTGAGQFTPGGHPTVDLTDRIFNPPAVSANGSAQGFTMPGGQAAIDTTATPVPRAPLQIGYNAPSAPRIPGAGIEGMGDFAPAAQGVARGAGKGLLRTVGGAAMRVAAGPEALAAAVLTPIADAQSAATANSNGPVLGLSRGDRIFGMTGGPRPGEAFSTNAISYNNPITGAPQAVTQSVNQSVPQMPGGAQAATGPTPVAPWVAHPEDWSHPETPTPAAAAPAGLTFGGNVGYVGLGGEKKLHLEDLGVDHSAQRTGYNGLFNGAVPGQPANSADLIDNIINRRDAGGMTGQVQDDITKAQRVNAANGLGGGLQFKTAADFMNGNNMPASGQGAAFMLRHASALAAQHNQQMMEASTIGQKQQELGLKGKELDINASRINAELPYYAAHANMANAQAKYYAARPEELESRYQTMRDIASQKDATMQQKIAEAAQAPLNKADAEFYTTLAQQTGGALPPSQIPAAVAQGFTTPVKPKTHWFSPNEPGGLTNAAGQRFTSAAPSGAVVPPGMTQIGTSGGKPVFQDAKGNRFSY